MTAGRSVRSRRGAWARVAVPLALGCLVLQLGSAAHLVLSPHSICAEHGEIVDGAAPHDGVRPVPVERAVIARSGDPAEQSAHEHDHCPLASHRREAALAAPQAVRVPACRQAPDGVLADLHDRARSSLDLILVAPKSSPPPTVAA